MLLLYIGKKAPLELTMPWLSEPITFEDKPVEVPTGVGRRLLAESPNSFRLVGEHGRVGHVIDDEEEIEGPIPGGNEDPPPKEPTTTDPDAITKESLDELTKAEIGALIKEKFGIDLNTGKNKEAVISDALAIVSAA